jgi:hypothetical protein
LNGCQHLSSEDRPGNYDLQEERRWYGCDEIYYNEDDDYGRGVVQPACEYWPDLLSDSTPGASLPHPSPPRVEVHIVGMFFENKVVVDPRNVGKYRAVWNPANHSDTAHIIMISDNKDAESRLHPDTTVYSGTLSPIHPWPPGDGDISNLVSETQRGWWGPSEAADTTPNVLSHEIFHALTGWLDPTDPQNDTPLVQVDTIEGGSKRRGFSMDFPGATGDQTCSLATGSEFTN